ncbi:unnamed protein product [Heterobilharzia americana]|nr:unnamed protein product [Heterobilharzia americana]
MPSTLEYLKKHTVVVGDTGDFESMKQYLPVDSTTNPSLILSACKLPQYSHLLDSAIEYAKKQKTLNEQVETALERVFVLFGCEILKVVPGRVSTEVDARYSFSIQKQVETARRLIAMYEELGVSKERILIKLSSTWEGIKAAEILESQYGIHCNLTLMFSFYQAVACAEAKITLISPFVGRVLDWYTTKHGKKEFTRQDDPGVKLVTRIYNYYKAHGYKTQIMGASFRNVNQILGLTGCDLLTIAPSLLEELSKMSEEPSVCLSVEKAKSSNDCYSPEHPLTEEEFRWQMNEDEMASDKLTDGIRRFAKDSMILADLIKTHIEQK